jgi:hypothetical protein
MMLIVLSSCTGDFHGVSAQPQKEKAKGMSNVVFATFAEKPAALSGQSFPVDTVFDNRGTAPAQVLSRESPSSLTYILRSQDSGGPAYTLSQTLTDRRRSPERPDTPVFETETIPAGVKFERTEDIADYWDEGFKPGKYWLTVMVDGQESPKSPVTILPLQVESIASAVNGTVLSTVIAHRRADGQIAILHRESIVLDPREGVFFLRQMLPKGGPVSVATALDLVPAGSGRWFAWEGDGQLTATVGWGNHTNAPTAPIAVQGTLLPVAFQIGGGNALFGVISPAGRLSTFLAGAQGLTPYWSAELPGARGTVRWNAQVDGSITVAWQDVKSGRIDRQDFRANGHPVHGTPTAVGTRAPLAWGLPETGPAAIWTLAPGADGLTLARLLPNGEETSMHAPALPGGQSWDFCQASGGDSAVAAISNGKIYFTSLTSPAWKEVSDSPGAQGFHIVSLNGRSLWAEWIEPGSGFRRVSLR